MSVLLLVLKVKINVGVVVVFVPTGIAFALLYA